MRKIYVIDTNILIHAPEAILNFEDNEVLLPMVVLEELDGLKNSEKEKGRMPERQFVIWRIFECRAIL